jgi:Putative adhesin
MTARTDRRVALVAGAVVAVLCILGAAVQVASWSLGRVHRDLHRTIPGPVSTLRIDARGGDITVVPGGNDVVIDARSSGAVHVPRLATDVSGDHVTVSGGCPTFTFGHCSSSITVRVPATTAVVVRSATGDIDLHGLIGGADVHTASGDVSASDLGGTVSLESASGDVNADGLRADRVRARTASGDVLLRFARAPHAADAETASGDARILVPPGRAAYRADVDTHSGDRSIGVRVDDTSSRLLRAHTSSGDAVLDYAG